MKAFAAALWVLAAAGSVAALAQAQDHYGSYGPGYPGNYGPNHYGSYYGPNYFRPGHYDRRHYGDYYGPYHYPYRYGPTYTGPGQTGDCYADSLNGRVCTDR